MLLSTAIYYSHQQKQFKLSRRNRNLHSYMRKCVCLSTARFSNDSVLHCFHLVVFSYVTMKTRSKKCASAQKKEQKKRKINPNLVILACIDLIQKENATLMTVSEKHLKILAKRFKVKSENVKNILKGFQPIVILEKM